MKVAMVSVVKSTSGPDALYIRTESLFDRWDMESWLKQMVPNAKVFNDDVVRDLKNNELVIHCSASDMAKIRLIC